MARRAPEQPKGFSGTVLAVSTAAALAIGIVMGLQLSVLQTPPQARQASRPAAAQPQVTAADQAAARIPGLKSRAESNPDSAPAWIDLANAYFDADMPEPAVHAYQHALDLAPGNADALTDMGVMLRELGRFQEAVAAFDKARDLDPAHRNARFNKGVVLFHDLNDKAGALASWKEVLAIDPNALSPDGTPLKNMIQGLEKTK
ncbi:MAG: tetratricopeptide repeat protein [Thermodesulfobacteriota bacterium]